MKRTAAALAILMASVSFSAYAAETVMVGGQAMYPNKTIVGNAVNSADHTTLVAAVKAAGLVDALNGKGPLTVFAPTNAAFAALPAGTVDTLLKPENKDKLTSVLTYHVVAGDYTSAKLKAAIKAGRGQAELKTLAGGSLVFTMNGPDNIAVRDAKGGVADIIVYDVKQSNGEIFSIDKVLLPG